MEQETEFLSENGYARVSKTDSYVILETTRKVATEGVGMVGYSRIANTLQVYENESIVFFPVDEDTSAAIYDTVSSALPRSIQNGSHEVTEADDFGCARFTIKISYTVAQKDDGFTYYDLTSVSGGFYDAYTSGNYVGENVYVRAHSVSINQFGKPYNSSLTIDERVYNYELDVNNRNWTYTVPPEWQPIGDGDIWAQIVVHYDFTLGRGASSWQDRISVSAF